MTAYAGLVSSILAVALVLGAPTPWLGLTGALLLACVPAGAAVMSWIDSGEAAAQAGLTLAVSLTAVALGSAIMIWLAAWQPRALLVLAGRAVVSCALRLRVARVAAGCSMSALGHTLRAGRVARHASLTGRVQAQLALPADRTRRVGVWRESAAPELERRLRAAGGRERLLRAGPGGADGRFRARASRRTPRGWLLTLNLVGLIVAIHATIPIIYGGTPEYAWVYKHVGIISSFSHYGRITDAREHL